jgi:hypothetical protein
VKSYRPESGIREGSRLMVSLMSGREKKGNWHPGNPQHVLTVMGGVCLDLTEVEAPEVNLNLFTLMGGTEVIVPHGAKVDLDGFILMGATVDNIATSNTPSNMHVRIRSFGAMGGCEVRTPTAAEMPLPEEKTPAGALVDHRDFRHPPEHALSISGALVVLYTSLAMLVSLAVPVMFLLGAFDFVDDDESKLLGIVTAIGCGFLVSAQ